MVPNVAIQRGSARWRTSLLRTTGGVALTIVAAVVGAGLPAVEKAVFSTSATGIWSGVVLVLIAGAPAATRLRRDPLDAPGLYAASTIVFLGLTSLAWLGTPILPGPGLGQANVGEALRLVAVGLVAFGVGTWLVAPPSGKRSYGVPPDQFVAPSATTLLAFFGLSLVAVVISFALGTYGYISDTAALARDSAYTTPLSVAGIVGNFVLIATAVSYYATRDPRLLRLVVLFAVSEMVIGFVGGNKLITLMPLMFVLGAYVMAHRRVPVVPTVLTVVFVLVVVVPTNLRYREGIHQQPQAPSSALRAALSAPLELNPVVAFTNAGNYVGSRFRSIDSVALIMDNTPSPFPYVGGETYLLLPAIALIPRAAWADKPQLNESGKFTQTYSQAPTTVVSATQITQVGDLYRNFGYIGTVIGLFCVGLLAGGGMHLFHRYESPRAQLVYVYTAMTVIIYVESDLPALLATASKTLPVAAITAWLLLPGRCDGPGYERVLRRVHGRDSAESRS